MDQSYTTGQDFTHYVDSIFANMKSFSQHDGMIGKPVSEGGKTFLPVISVTMGYGGGDSHTNTNTGTQGKSGKMMGDVLGVGAKLCTDAVIVIDGNNVLLAPIGAKGGMAQMIDKIPQILGGMGQGGQQAQQQQQQQQQSTQQNTGY